MIGFPVPRPKSGKDGQLGGCAGTCLYDHDLFTPALQKIAVSGGGLKGGEELQEAFFESFVCTDRERQYALGLGESSGTLNDGETQGLERGEHP